MPGLINAAEVHPLPGENNYKFVLNPNAPALTADQFEAMLIGIGKYGVEDQLKDGSLLRYMTISFTDKAGYVWNTYYEVRYNIFFPTIVFGKPSVSPTFTLLIERLGIIEEGKTEVFHLFYDQYAPEGENTAIFHKPQVRSGNHIIKGANNAIEIIEDIDSLTIVNEDGFEDQIYNMWMDVGLELIKTLDSGKAAL